MLYIGDGFVDRITKNLIKNYTVILATVIISCLISSSIFLSQFYVNEQFKTLKSNAESICSYIENGMDFEIASNISAVMLKDNSVMMMGRNGKGIMSYLKETNLSNLSQKGRFENSRGEEFLYYKINTDYGDLLVFQDYKLTTGYLKSVYIILILVFTILLLLSAPFILYTGKKFTRPILILQKASEEIAAGNFNVNIDLQTGNEFENLAESLNHMALSLNKKYTMQKKFITNVSHDFRTPLSIIRGYIEPVLDGVVEPEKQNYYLTEAIIGVERLNTLISSLMLLSKLQSGEYRPNKEKINIKDSLLECVTYYKSTADKKNIGIILNVEDTEVYADYNEISRVIRNLIDNAIKFSSEGSCIKVGTELIKNRVKIFVKDYGIGIEPEMMDDIWNRYYKHLQSGGMGLGLAISAEILKLHGYEYGVKSNLGEGSEFYFYIS